jgi:hypothetical protein
MTIVIAQIRGEEILIMGDTMVQEPEKKKHDVIPGRLKVIALGQHVTVAFAGMADIADGVIRRARKALHQSGIADVRDILKEASRNGDIDFILASHSPKANLSRVRGGVFLPVPDVCAIGNDEPFKALIDRARSSPETGPLNQSDLRYKFMDKLLTNNNLGSTIGGFPITLHANAERHAYLRASAHYTFKFPEMLAGEDTVQPLEQVYTGDGFYHFYIVPSDVHDLPIVGVVSLQARTGFIYSPIRSVEAIRVSLLADSLDWEGKEQAMFNLFKQELEKHVAALDHH